MTPYILVDRYKLLDGGGGAETPIFRDISIIGIKVPKRD
jgi:hypothetical protein